MADSTSGSGQYKKLPPGWDCKYDKATGNCYYINYFTKAMQLEDPRMCYRPLQEEKCSNESISLAPLHGSPYHVYPGNNYPIQRAFQGPAIYQDIRNASSTSPLLSSRSNLEMSPLPLLKRPVTPQISRLANTTRRSTIQETSFTNNIDTDGIVAKIQNMFPTAEENHIRLLLKRYYNREAVVISALQVEKHPVTMPGPFVTPPAQRHLFHSNTAFYMTPTMRRLDALASTSRGGGCDNIGLTGGINSRTASPLPGGRFGSAMSMQSGGAAAGMGGMGSALANAAVNGIYGQMIPSYHHGSPRFGDQMRNSPKPHSSPKMKLRYMKTIFPKADETLLLDILANSDNNVQSASEKLIKMGYVKRDFITPKLNNRSEVRTEADKTKKDDIIIIPLRPKEYTVEEKEAMKIRLKQKYDKIAERIILMALESVNYAEDRAMQILQIVQEEDDVRERKANELMQTNDQRQSVREVAAGETVIDGKEERFTSHSSSGGNVKDHPKLEFKSLLDRTPAKGHNSTLSKGSDDGLLLVDYITWNGANPDISMGQKSIVQGPDATLLSERNYVAVGHNSGLCKGPQPGLAKGSIYSRLTTAASDIKCK